MKRRLTLTFTSELVTEPVIYNLGQQFRLVTNIRSANITEERGWMMLEVEGEEEDIENGLAWAISRGVRVEITEEG